MTIRDKKQPLIKSSVKNRGEKERHIVYLVPELMRMMGIPESIRRNFNKMKELASFTKMGVDRRVQALMKFNSRLLTTDKVRFLLDYLYSCTIFCVTEATTVYSPTLSSFLETICKFHYPFSVTC